jgi:hypothetical protein
MHRALSHRSFLALAVLFLALQSAPVCARFIIISEILRNPAGNSTECPGDKCHEFIEFTNLGTDTLSLDSLFITSGAYTDSVSAWTDTITRHANCIYSATHLLPGQTALILDRQYDSIPAFAIADSTILLTVNHVSLLGGLTASRGVVLYKGARDAIIDSLASAIDSGLEAHAAALELTPLAAAREGYSLVPSQVLFAPAQYQPHPDSLDPGIFGPIQNGWIVEYRLSVSAAPASSVVCSAAVMKAGSAISLQAAWQLLDKTNNTVIVNGSIAAGAGPHFFAFVIPADSVAHELVVSDTHGSATKKIDLSTVWLPQSLLKISEVFPRATATVGEWVELVNVSSMPVNIKYWRLGTPESADTITTADYIVPPQSYCIVTKDVSLFSKAYPVIAHAIEPSHWQALDNYHDTLVLWSPLHSQPHETVFYTYQWFDLWENESLERVSLSGSGTTRSDWALSTVPTPGQPNSSVVWRSAAAPGLHIGPVPFAPNGDGKDEQLLIGLTLPAGAGVKVSVYGFSGQKLAEIAQPLKEKNYWSGKTDNGSDAAVGPFFVIAEFNYNGKKELIRKKGILWR